MEPLLQDLRLQKNEQRFKALLLRGLAGDGAAYQEFLERLRAHLKGFFSRRLFQWPADIEDLVQETLMGVHKQRHAYQQDQPLTVWVHAIARYKLVDLLRSKSHFEAFNQPLDDELQLGSTSDADANEARSDLAKLLADLPDRQRLPIVHVKLEGLSVLQVAHMTGMSESAVKAGVHRGLKVLAARIKKVP